MTYSKRWALPIILCVAIAAAAAVPAGSSPVQEKKNVAGEIGKVQDAIRVMDEMMKEADKSIPLDLLESCAGIAIIPDVIKAAYVVGGRHGSGILMMRRDGRWSDPVFINLTGGSIGWQIGVESADVVLVFRTPRGIDNITRGKFTLGADAGLSVGPVGRSAQAATDVSMKAEILSYSRSRGLYAGLSLQGAAIQVDRKADQNFYGVEGVGPQAIFEGKGLNAPEVVKQLKETLEKYSTPGMK